MFKLATKVGGKSHTVVCDESTARYLFPIWARECPEHATCYDLDNNGWVNVFLEEVDKVLDNAPAPDYYEYHFVQSERTDEFLFVTKEVFNLVSVSRMRLTDGTELVNNTIVVRPHFKGAVHHDIAFGNVVGSVLYKAQSIFNIMEEIFGGLETPKDFKNANGKVFNSFGARLTSTHVVSNDEDA
jgi:hypothetical protein